MIRATVMGISRSSFFFSETPASASVPLPGRNCPTAGRGSRIKSVVFKATRGGSRFNPAFDHRRGGGNLLFVFSHLVHGFGDAFFSFLTGLFQRFAGLFRGLIDCFPQLCPSLLCGSFGILFRFTASSSR